MHRCHDAILLVAAFSRTLAWQQLTHSLAGCLTLSLPWQPQQLLPLSFPHCSWPVYKQEASDSSWDFLELCFFFNVFFFFLVFEHLIHSISILFIPQHPPDPPSPPTIQLHVLSFIFIFFNSNLWCLSVRPALEHGPTTRGPILKENQLSLWLSLLCFLL